MTATILAQRREPIPAARPTCSTASPAPTAPGMRRCGPRLLNTAVQFRRGVMAEPPPGWCADYVVLTAYETPVPSATRILTADRARAELSARQWRLLQDPVFEVRSVPGYPAPVFGHTSDAVPVIDTRIGSVVWRYDDDLLWSGSPPHRAALVAVRQVFVSAATNLTVQAHDSVTVPLFAVMTARSGLLRQVSQSLVCVPSAHSRFHIDEITYGDMPSPQVIPCTCSSAVEE